MFIIDSNILVYSRLAGYEYLREILSNQSTFISEISRVEVLGYHRITPEEEIYFKKIFNIIPILFPTNAIFDEAINIRRNHNLKLGDSIIAATAVIYDLTVYTRNIKDFSRVSKKCVNPVI